MSNLGQLTSFELKKIFSRRITWISLAVTIIIMVFSGFAGIIGDYYIDDVFIETNYEAQMKDNNYMRKLSGRKVDSILISEMQEAYAKIPDTGNKHYTSSEEYQTFARPYSTIRSWVYGLTRDNYLTATEDDVYQARQVLLEKQWKNLTSSEITYWQEKEANLEKRFTFGYTTSYANLLLGIYSLAVVQILLLAICLSPMFAEEHTRRTDQLILSSRHGKSVLYIAKLLAGIIFSLIATLTLYLSYALPNFIIFGTDGFNTAIQITMPNYSSKLTIGQGALILTTLLFIAAVMISVCIMFLSEAWRNSVAVMGLITGVTILSLILNVPENYRIPSQIWNLLPNNLISRWGAFDIRLYPFFNTWLTSWQFGIILYLLIAIILSVIGSKKYRNYQVQGR